MIYIFEDHAESLIPRFFASCYSKTSNVCVVDKDFAEVDWEFYDMYIIFSKGDKRLRDVVARLIRITEHKIYVYLDLLPDNQATRYIYNTLRVHFYSFRNRLLIMPIPSIEFVYIVLAHKAGLAYYDNEALDIINKNRFEDSSFCVRNRLSPKNYENYMKQFCSLGLIGCARIKRSARWKTTMQHAKYLFLFCDCICERPIADHECYNYLLVDKKKDFLECFPGVPRIDSDGSLRKYPHEYMNRIYKELVNDYNAWVTSYYNDPVKREDHYIKLMYCKE